MTFKVDLTNQTPFNVKFNSDSDQINVRFVDESNFNVDFTEQEVFTAKFAGNGYQGPAGAFPIHDSENTYVIDNGVRDSAERLFIALQEVPSGIALSDAAYWAAAASEATIGVSSFQDSEITFEDRSGNIAGLIANQRVPLERFTNTGTDPFAKASEVHPSSIVIHDESAIRNFIDSEYQGKVVQIYDATVTYEVDAYVAFAISSGEKAFVGIFRKLTDAAAGTNPTSPADWEYKHAQQLARATTETAASLSFNTTVPTIARSNEDISNAVSGLTDDQTAAEIVTSINASAETLNAARVDLSGVITGTEVRAIVDSEIESIHLVPNTVEIAENHDTGVTLLQINGDPSRNRIIMSTAILPTIGATFVWNEEPDVFTVESHGDALNIGGINRRLLTISGPRDIALSDVGKRFEYHSDSLATWTQYVGGNGINTSLESDVLTASVDSETIRTIIGNVGDTNVPDYIRSFTNLADTPLTIAVNATTGDLSIVDDLPHDLSDPSSRTFSFHAGTNQNVYQPQVELYRQTATVVDAAGDEHDFTIPLTSTQVGEFGGFSTDDRFIIEIARNGNTGQAFLVAPNTNTLPATGTFTFNTVSEDLYGLERPTVGTTHTVTLLKVEAVRFDRLTLGLAPGGVEVNRIDNNVPTTDVNARGLVTGDAVRLGLDAKQDNITTVANTPTIITQEIEEAETKFTVDQGIFQPLGELWSHPALVNTRVITFTFIDNDEREAARGVLSQKGHALRPTGAGASGEGVIQLIEDGVNDNQLIVTLYTPISGGASDTDDVGDAHLQFGSVTSDSIERLTVSGGLRTTHSRTGDTDPVGEDGIALDIIGQNVRVVNNILTFDDAAGDEQTFTEIDNNVNVTSGVLSGTNLQLTLSDMAVVPDIDLSALVDTVTVNDLQGHFVSSGDVGLLVQDHDGDTTDDIQLNINTNAIESDVINDALLARMLADTDTIFTSDNAVSAVNAVLSNNDQTLTLQGPSGPIALTNTNTDTDTLYVPDAIAQIATNNYKVARVVDNVFIANSDGNASYNLVVNGQASSDDVIVALVPEGLLAILVTSSVSGNFLALNGLTTATPPTIASSTAFPNTAVLAPVVIGGTGGGHIVQQGDGTILTQRANIRLGDNLAGVDDEANDATIINASGDGGSSRTFTSDTTPPADAESDDEFFNCDTGITYIRTANQWIDKTGSGIAATPDDGGGTTETPATVLSKLNTNDGSTDINENLIPTTIARSADVPTIPSNNLTGSSDLTDFPDGLARDTELPVIPSDNLTGSSALADFPDGLTRDTELPVIPSDNLTGSSALTDFPDGLARDAELPVIPSDNLTGSSALADFPDGLTRDTELPTIPDSETPATILTKLNTNDGSIDINENLIPTTIARSADVPTIPSDNLTGSSALTDFPDGLARDTELPVIPSDNLTGSSALADFPDGLARDTELPVIPSDNLTGSSALADFPDGLTRDTELPVIPDSETPATILTKLNTNDGSVDINENLIPTTVARSADVRANSSTADTQLGLFTLTTQGVGADQRVHITLTSDGTSKASVDQSGNIRALNIIAVEAEGDL